MSATEFACIGGPLDGQKRPRPAFFYEPWHDALTLRDEETGAEYALRWTATSSAWYFLPPEQAT